MTTIWHDDDGDLGALDGAAVAVVGYGNQGRSWALNLRDSGLDVTVCVRADESRERANDTATTEIYTLSLHDSPISVVAVSFFRNGDIRGGNAQQGDKLQRLLTLLT